MQSTRIEKIFNKNPSHNNENNDSSNGKNNYTNSFKTEIAAKTNLKKISGDLEKVIKDADVFIGTTGKGKILNDKMIKSMNCDPIIFALSNPDPEILPENALAAGAKIIATGRSDYPNQINNAVVFPSIFRALLDLRIKNIDEDILIAVAQSIANLVDSEAFKRRLHHTKNE